LSKEPTVPYTQEKPRTAPSSEELRQKIPGWGVDLRPEVRPSYPREDPSLRLAPWDYPDQQPEKWPRERSTEHKYLTPVFGTAQPLHGLSGAIRRYAYTFSEGRLAHWMLLIAGDRVDVLESRIMAAIRGQPDNPITESGVAAEFKDRGYRTRFGQHRADLKHQPLDLLLWAVPYAGVIGGIYFLTKSMRERR
jgi:hypothetical protein